MHQQKKSLLFGICLLSVLICTASAATSIREYSGSSSPNPSILLNDPILGTNGYLVWPGSGDQLSSGDRTPTPDERFSYPQSGYQPVQPSPVINPYPGTDPSPVIVKPSPDERISYPEPVSHPEQPAPATPPNPGTDPSLVVVNPSPDERISYPDLQYHVPYQNTIDQPYIYPTPTPRWYEPVGSIYPVYDDSPPYIRHQSYDDKDFYSYTYYSRDWYRTGSIQIISTPARAEVYLNSKYRGKTPYSGFLEIPNLVPGTYELRVQYSGYVPYSRIVQVERDEVKTINVVLSDIQEQVTGETSIRINSEPSGSNVLIDNEYRGITPVTLSNLVSGEHTVTLQKTGYTDFVTKVQTVQGQTLPVTGVMIILPPPPTALPTIPPTPVQTPVPVATQAGLPNGLVIISLVVGILILLSGQKR
ncbi:MAG: PEGA domain-containing protein [Methanobacteriota archaeon]